MSANIYHKTEFRPGWWGTACNETNALLVSRNLQQNPDAIQYATDCANAAHAAAVDDTFEALKKAGVRIPYKVQERLTERLSARSLLPECDQCGSRHRASEAHIF